MAIRGKNYGNNYVHHVIVDHVIVHVLQARMVDCNVNNQSDDKTSSCYRRAWWIIRSSKNLDSAWEVYRITSDTRRDSGGT